MDTLIDNLKRLLLVLPMTEVQRATIQAAIDKIEQLEMEVDGLDGDIRAARDCD